METTIPKSMCLTLSLATVLRFGIAIANAEGSDPAAMSREVSHHKTGAMKISIEVEGKVITVTLEDSAVSTDFITLLPLTLTLNDYASTEKISDLPRRLSTQGAPAGSDPSIGDITYYSPWGNLAIFYRDSGYASGLIKLGKINSGIEALNRPGSFRVKIDLINE
jgi:hypothetical protein